MGKKRNKEILKLVKNVVFRFFNFLGTKTWFLTIVFFGSVLVASVLVWWQCVYDPKPSAEVISKIEREREDFDDMKKKTMEAIKLLQGYRDNYNNTSKFEEQRELFIDILDEDVKKQIEDEKKLLEAENEEQEQEVVDLDQKVEEVDTQEAGASEIK